MQRKFLANLLLLLFLNILVKPLYIFGIDLGVQNLVGPDEYGIFFSMFNFTLLFNIVLDAGITSFNNRNISQYKHLLNKHFSGIVTIRLLLAVAYTIITISVGLLVGYGSRQMWLLVFLAINQFIISSVLYLRSNISGLQMFKTDSLVSVLDRVILILLCGYMLYSRYWRAHFTIEIFVGCQTVSYLITFIVALLIVIRKSAFRKFYWNPVFARMIIRKSFPYALLALLMMFYFRMDSVLLERILPEGTGARQAGIYASAFRLLDAFLMIPYLFSALLLPMFSKMIRYKENVGQLISLSFPIILLFSVSIIALSEGFSNEIMALLYKDHALESAKVFRLLIPGLIGYSTSFVFATLLTANGSLKTLNIIAASGMLLNILLNIILIPRYEAIGSALASFLTLNLSAILQLIIAIRLFKLYPGRKQIIRGGLFFASVLAILWLQVYLPFSWPVRFLSSGVLIVLISFIIGFIQPLRMIRILLRH
jgi:O-antigen/teichoic acid export membrane protein